MTVSREIPLNSLVLDSENPRLDAVQDSQRDTIRAMIEAQGEKLVALAADIEENRLDPSQSLIVMPEGDTGKRFIVLEGNRRTTALKLLDHPELAEGHLQPALYRRLTDLGQRFAKNPLRTVRCAVVNSRDEADHWIMLRHTGEQQGAGIVSWGATESARFAARRGKSSAALKVLEFVREHAGLDDATQAKLGKLSITNLQRLINDPYVRSKLGIEKEKEEISTQYPTEEVVKGLARIVLDLANQGIIVSDIDTKEQRKKYVNGFKKEELPDKATMGNDAQPLGTLGKAAGTTATAGKKSAPKPSTSTRAVRNTLIPKSCLLRISSPRIDKIYRELRRIRLDDFPNAAGVLLRVFLELSAEEYVTREKLMPQQQLDNAKLRDKISAAANHLESKGLITQQQLQPVRRAIQEQHPLAASLKTMHGYVHNPHFNPSPTELRTAWDNFEPFLQTLWT